MLKHMIQKEDLQERKRLHKRIVYHALMSEEIILALLHIYLYLFYVSTAIALACSGSKEIIHTSNDKT